MKKYELKSKQIYTKSLLKDSDIASLPKTSPILGQDDALEAINFGIQMKATGYNIFCTGPKGVGRTVLTIQTVKEYAASQKTPDDWCIILKRRISRSRLIFPPAAVKFLPKI